MICFTDKTLINSNRPAWYYYAGLLLHIKKIFDTPDGVPHALPAPADE